MHRDAIVDLLRTHSAADPSDLEEIRRRGKLYQSEVGTWQRRLDAAIILVDVLQAKVSLLAKQRDMYTSYMSPVQRLPAEMLSLIFAEASAEDPDFDVFSSAGRSKALISHTLAQVCKFWRDVALRTPAIWRHDVVFSLSPHQCLDHEGDAIRHRLQQTLDLYGSNLTQVYLHLPDYDWPICKTIRDAILQKQGRLKALKLIGQVFDHSLPSHEVSTPLLEEMLLSVDPCNSGCGVSVTFDAPCLTKLSIYYPPTLLPNLSLPWQQITYMSLGFPYLLTGVVQWFSLGLVLDFLQHLSSLIDLHLVGMNIDYPISPDLSKPRLVTLPKLRCFELNDFAGRTASVIAPQSALHAIRPCYSLLTHLSTPRLQQFDWVIPAFGVHQSPYVYSCYSIRHFLAAAPLLRLVRVAICDFDELLPAGTRTGILRLTGSMHDFSTLVALGGLEWAANQSVYKLAEHRDCPPSEAPKLYFNNFGLLSSVDNYIDRYLEQGEGSTAYGPFQRYSGLHGPTQLRLHEVAQTGRVIMTILLGGEGGTVGCQRRLYVTI